jgi:hypothetical protein
VGPTGHWLPSRAVDTYRIYDDTDENGIVGTVAPGLFARGCCWRMGTRDADFHNFRPKDSEL